jgi:hypothetical protein
VRDKDDADAGSFQIGDEADQRVDFMAGKRGGRFVHDPTWRRPPSRDESGAGDSQSTVLDSRVRSSDAPCAPSPIGGRLAPPPAAGYEMAGDEMFSTGFGKRDVIDDLNTTGRRLDWIQVRILVPR